MYPQKPNMRKASLLHSYREEILMIRRAPLVIVGIDLAGSPRRVTGLCVLRNLTAETRVAFSADDILDFVREAQPTLVPIDARSACRMDGGRSMTGPVNIFASAIASCTAEASASSRSRLAPCAC